MRLTSLLYVGPFTAGWGLGWATMRCRAAKSTSGAAARSRKSDNRRDMIGDDTPDGGAEALKAERLKGWKAERVADVFFVSFSLPSFQPSQFIVISTSGASGSAYSAFMA